MEARNADYKVSNKGVFFLYSVILPDEQITITNNKGPDGEQYRMRLPNIRSLRSEATQNIIDYSTEPDNIISMMSVFGNLLSSMPHLHGGGGSISAPVDTSWHKLTSTLFQRQNKKQEKNVVLKMPEPIDSRDIELNSNVRSLTAIYHPIVTDRKNPLHTEAWIITRESPESVQRNGKLNNRYTLTFTDQKTAGNFLSAISSLQLKPFLLNPELAENIKAGQVQVDYGNWDEIKKIPADIDSLIPKIKQEISLMKSNKTFFHQMDALLDQLAAELSVFKKNAYHFSQKDWAAINSMEN